MASTGRSCSPTCSPACSPIASPRVAAASLWSVDGTHRTVAFDPDARRGTHQLARALLVHEWPRPRRPHRDRQLRSRRRHIGAAVRQRRATPRRPLRRRCPCRRRAARRPTPSLRPGCGNVVLHSAASSPDRQPTCCSATIASRSAAPPDLAGRVGARELVDLHHHARLLGPDQDRGNVRAQLLDGRAASRPVSRRSPRTRPRPSGRRAVPRPRPLRRRDARGSRSRPRPAPPTRPPTGSTPSGAR